MLLCYRNKINPLLHMHISSSLGLTRRFANPECRVWLEKDRILRKGFARRTRKYQAYLRHANPYFFESKFHRRFGLELRGEAAHGANLCSVEKEKNRNRNHRNCDETQNTRSPVDAQLVIHLSREQGECSAQSRSNQGVRGDGTVGVHHVHIDDVIQALHENDQNTHTNRDSSNDLRGPMDVWR